MSTGPRILFVNHTSQVSGAEMVLLDVAAGHAGDAGSSAFLFEQGALVDALRARRLAVEVARGGGGLSHIRRDSSPLRALPQLLRLAFVTAGLARAARRHDVVYANSQKAFVLAAFAAWIARRPLIWHLHDIIDASHFGRAQRWLQVTLANRLARRVVVPSAAAARAFIAAGGHADRVCVVANGLDLAPDPRSRAALRQALRLPDGFLFGVFSRLAPWKGQHVAIEALTMLPGAQCVIVGSGLFGEHDYARHLHDLAASSGVADRVHFLGQRSDVGVIMQAMDAVVHPSIHPEPFGRTLVEAMLLSIPVIATDTGAAAEILDDERAGMLVPPADVVSLAAALTALMTDPASAQPRIQCAEHRARTVYDSRTMRAALDTVMRRVAPAPTIDAAPIDAVPINAVPNGTPATSVLHRTRS